MSSVVPVGSDCCGLDDLFLAYGTEAQRGCLCQGVACEGDDPGDACVRDREDLDRVRAVCPTATRPVRGALILRPRDAVRHHAAGAGVEPRRWVIGGQHQGFKLTM